MDGRNNEFHFLSLAFVKRYQIKMNINNYLNHDSKRFKLRFLEC